MNLAIRRAFGNFRTGRLVQEISIIDGISKIRVREDGIDLFFVKKTQQKILCPKQHESTEKLDLMQRAFENEGLESKVLKTWTPPKQSLRKRKWKRFYQRLCDGMEKEVKNHQKISSAEEAVESSGEEEAVEPSGEGDERPCDDVKLCLVKASLSADLKSASLETPSLSCVEKTETEKPSGEGHEDPCDDGSDSNDESLESESELCRGSEEQPARQEDFVQQPAKQEAVPRASHQKVVKIDDELEETTAEFMERHRKFMDRHQKFMDRPLVSEKMRKFIEKCDRWCGKEENCSDGLSDYDSS